MSDEYEMDDVWRDYNKACAERSGEKPNSLYDDPKIADKYDRKDFDHRKRMGRSKTFFFMG